MTVELFDLSGQAALVAGGAGAIGRAVVLGLAGQGADWLAADPDRKAGIVRRIPIGRLGRPDDFVGPVIFLASRASAFMLGQTLFVDGGSSVTHPLFGS